MTRTRLNPIGARGRRLAPGDAEWRRLVMVSASGYCQWPTCRNKAVHAHHYEGRQARPELRHDVSNGRALCASCHVAAHRYPNAARTMLAHEPEREL